MWTFVDTRKALNLPMAEAAKNVDSKEVASETDRHGPSLAYENMNFVNARIRGTAIR